MFGACLGRWASLLPTAGAPGLGGRREGHPHVESARTWPTLKNTRRQRRLIVFVDESGLSTKPTRVRTWAPRGRTPLLHESFNWKSLSIIGGLTLQRFYFQMHRQHQKPAGRGVPQTPVAPPQGPPPDNLGRGSHSSQPVGARFPCDHQREKSSQKGSRLT